MKQVSSLITQKLETIAELPDIVDPTFHSKRKAISALFPYAVRLAQDGERGMIDSISRVASKSMSGEFMWHRIKPYITTLFDESSPPYLNQAIALASPCASWAKGPYTQSKVARWAAAALATPHSEEVRQSVIHALLQIALNNSLRPHIPTEIWAWLKSQPPLQPVCKRRARGTTPDAVRHIRELGDIEILKPYLLLAWSEWTRHCDSGIAEMETAIREDFCGITARCHREDLTQRLDHILGELRRRPWEHGYHIERAERQYGRLKEVLQEVDRSALEILSRMHPEFDPFKQVG